MKKPRRVPKVALGEASGSKDNPPLGEGGGLSVPPTQPTFGVNAFGAGPGSAAGMFPLSLLSMAPHLHQISKPAIFADTQDAWVQFEQDWKRYESLVDSSGIPIPDPIKLDIFKSLVGPASQALLQQMQNENPNRPFAEYYAMMEKTYGGDATRKHRKAWQNVKLEVGPDRRLTLKEFHKFQAEFKLKRWFVTGWTAEEEHMLICQNLPPAWIEKIVDEEAKRNRNKPWAKVTNTPDMSAGDLKDVLLGEEIEIKEVKNAEGGFNVLCANEAARTRLLEYHNQSLGGKIVRVSRISMRMTGDEMFEWILEKLKVHEEAESLRVMSSGRGFVSTTDERQVRSVEEIPNSSFEACLASSNPKPQTKPTTQGPPKATRIQNSQEIIDIPLPSPPIPTNPSNIQGPGILPFQGRNNAFQGPPNPPRSTGGRAPSPGGMQPPRNGVSPKANLGKGVGPMRGRSPARTFESNPVLTPTPQPTPGRWQGGFDARSCWRCEEEGKDFRHDWRECRDKRDRENERIARGEQQP